MENYYLIIYSDYRTNGGKLQRLEIEASNILAAISAVYELKGYVLIKSIELK